MNALTDQDLTTVLGTMDVPFFKTDITRPGCVHWLVHNLGTRNAGHAKYKVAMATLLAKAQKMNVVKASEVRRLEERVQAAAHQVS